MKHQRNSTENVGVGHSGVRPSALGTEISGAFLYMASDRESISLSIYLSHSFSQRVLFVSRVGPGYRNFIGFVIVQLLLGTLGLIRVQRGWYILVAAS